MHYRDPRRREREKCADNLFEDIIVKKFPNLGKEIDIQVQEVQKVPNKMNPKWSTPRHIIIKMAKIKDKENLKISKGKATSYF